MSSWSMILPSIAFARSSALVGMPAARFSASSSGFSTAPAKIAGTVAGWAGAGAGGVS